jgi:hypothetical protein
VPLLLIACSKRSTTTEPAPTPPEPAPAPAVDEPGTDRTTMTAGECDAKGGRVVGDIGDGAIHRPDYLCPDSAKPPLGTIAADPGGPIAVEGAVCCL